MYSRALLIYNGNAGQAETHRVLGAAVAILSPAIAELTLMPTQSQGDTERICRERGEDYELVIVLGGDGTVHECVNGLAPLEKPPIVGILPGGTCNDFARSLHVPLDIEQAAQAIVNGLMRPVDIGQAGERFFSNFYGIGLITDTSENINSGLKGMFGKLSYFVSTLQTLKAAKSFAYRLDMGDRVVDGEAVMVLVSNGRSIGTSALPTPLDALRDGLLDVFIIREAGIPLLIEVLSQKTSQNWDPEKSQIDYFQAPVIELTTNEPMRADTDGEIYTETPVRLSVVREKLRFITGLAQG
ncbi:lipid kinase [Paenibacillus swuensis]|uniref:Lipid kinase n=1 Tax=Paenibacillus swuensis TaxID=1178515 RepID=A0A172THR9_9BACL|nr:diacylglycerol kinase family protein [Paenibacillus swuensis]ANE46598.1 lipid kinase [Paenibacillus swuensis]